MNGHGRHSLAQPRRNSCRIKSHRCADLERRNTIGGGELVELPLADPQKNGKFRDSKSLRFFLQDFYQVHGFTPSLVLPHNTTWRPGNADVVPSPSFSIALQ